MWVWLIGMVVCVAWCGRGNAQQPDEQPVPDRPVIRGIVDAELRLSPATELATQMLLDDADVQQYVRRCWQDVRQLAQQRGRQVLSPSDTEPGIGGGIEVFREPDLLGKITPGDQLLAGNFTVPLAAHGQYLVGIVLFRERARTAGLSSQFTRDRYVKVALVECHPDGRPYAMPWCYRPTDEHQTTQYIACMFVYDSRGDCTVVIDGRSVSWAAP